MDRKYPDNDCVCETDDHWAGRNLLRDAFMKSAGNSRSYERSGLKEPGKPRIMQKVNHDTPLFWMIDTPETYRRRTFSIETAEKAARPIRAFLEANGVEVKDDAPMFRDTPKAVPIERDAVYVYANGSHCDPHANDPATVAMLPHMQRKIWNLVRYHDDEYKF